MSKPQAERDKAISHLFEYIEKSPQWAPLFEELARQLMVTVADHFDEGMDSVTERLLGGDFGAMAFGYLMELMAVTSWDKDRKTPIDTFLKERGWREGSHGRRYLKALNESRHDFLECTNVDAGRWIEVRPYGTTDKAQRVMEKSASQSLHPYDVIIARVVTLGKTRRFGAILQLSARAAQHVQDQLDQVSADLTQLYEEVVAEDGPEGLEVNFADEIPMERQRRIEEDGFSSWAIDVLEHRTHAAPQMYNTDEERVVLTKFRFPLLGDPAEIGRRLSACDGVIEQSDGLWTWLKPDAGQTVLGQFTLGKTDLILETNSVERGEQGVALLQRILGKNLVGAPMGVHENLDLPGASPPRQQQPPGSAELNQLPEIQAMLQQKLEEHYRKTLDESIPMLDNDSPRDCAVDPAKRDKVVAWLKYLENMESKSPQPSHDFGWMWDELGLSSYR